MKISPQKAAVKGQAPASEARAAYARLPRERHPVEFHDMMSAPRAQPKAERHVPIPSVSADVLSLVRETRRAHDAVQIYAAEVRLTSATITRDGDTLKVGPLNIGREALRVGEAIGWGNHSMDLRYDSANNKCLHLDASAEPLLRKTLAGHGFQVDGAAITRTFDAMVIQNGEDWRVAMPSEEAFHDTLDALAAQLSNAGIPIARPRGMVSLNTASEHSSNTSYDDGKLVVRGWSDEERAILERALAGVFTRVD